MKPLLATFLLLAVSVLAGCASHVSPELRPYTAEESRELALEALNRRGLSFDEYHAKKAELLGAAAEDIRLRQTGRDERRARRTAARSPKLSDCTARSFAQLSVGFPQGAAIGSIPD